MKIYKKLVLAFILAIWGFPALSQDDVIQFSDPDQAIIVTTESPTFTIRLQSNPSTGFGWFLSLHDQTLIQPIKQKYYAPKEGRPGAGGYEEWTFQVNTAAFKVPQLTSIDMVYARPWGKLENYKTAKFNIFTK